MCWEIAGGMAGKICGRSCAGVEARKFTAGTLGEKVAKFLNFSTLGVVRPPYPRVGGGGHPTLKGRVGIPPYT